MNIFLLLFQNIVTNFSIVVNLGEQNSKLLGKNAQEYAQILKWISFTSTEGVPHIATAFKGLTGVTPYNKKNIDEALKNLAVTTDVFEERLLNYTYLVGERLTLADIVSASLLIRGFDNLFDKEWRAANPNTARWFKTVFSHPIIKNVVGEYNFIEKAVQYTPPKKEKKQAAPAAKKEKAPAAKKEVEDDVPAEAPKPKHPLEALGKPSAPLDEWKRVYSNEETRETAIPWFWKNQYDPKEWSLWKVDFKYNDELTLTFMSNNQIGGFFARLSASTKYLFGCLVVYGENNNNGITGFLLVRGQDVIPAVDVAPDYESYEFTKLEDSPETREFVDNMLAWDKPVIVNGEAREIADGKVFK